MKINKINYEQLFPLPQPYSNVRLSIEINLEPGDTIADAFTRGHKEANENFNRLFPQAAHERTDYNTGEQSSAYSAVQAKEEADKEFNDFKIAIDSYISAQSAWDYLSSSPFKYSIEAKKYVTEKFSV